MNKVKSQIRGAQLEDFIAQTAFVRHRITVDSLGFELWLEKAEGGLKAVNTL